MIGVGNTDVELYYGNLIYVKCVGIISVYVFSTTVLIGL
jgi:hypothetical protein